MYPTRVCDIKMVASYYSEEIRWYPSEYVRKAAASSPRATDSSPRREPCGIWLLPTSPGTGRKTVGESLFRPVPGLVLTAD